MGLHRQNDDVLLPCLGVLVGGFDFAGRMLGAIVHDELHAVLANRIQVRTAHHERDIFATQCQLDPRVPTNGAGANDCDLHRSLLSSMLFEGLASALASPIANLPYRANADEGGHAALGLLVSTPTTCPGRSRFPCRSSAPGPCRSCLPSRDGLW